MDKKEMMNIIYDTLFGNTNYKQFSELDKGLSNQLIDNESNKIVFQYKNKYYRLSIEENKNILLT